MTEKAARQRMNELNGPSSGRYSLERKARKS